MQTDAVRKRTTNHQDVHNLMTRSIYVKSPGVETFWDSTGIYESSQSIETAKANKVRERLPLVLLRPPVDSDAMDCGSKRGAAEKKVYQDSDLASIWGTESRLKGTPCSCDRAECSKDKMSSPCEVVAVEPEIR